MRCSTICLKHGELHVMRGNGVWMFLMTTMGHELSIYEDLSCTNGSKGHRLFIASSKSNVLQIVERFEWKKNGCPFWEKEFKIFTSHLDESFIHFLHLKKLTSSVSWSSWGAATCGGLGPRRVSVVSSRQPCHSKGKNAQDGHQL